MLLHYYDHINVIYPLKDHLVRLGSISGYTFVYILFLKFICPKNIRLLVLLLVMTIINCIYYYV